jgi:hypothetical protein
MSECSSRPQALTDVDCAQIEVFTATAALKGYEVTVGLHINIRSGIREL